MARKLTYLTGDDVTWVSILRNNYKYIANVKGLRKKDIYSKLGMTPYEFKSILYSSTTRPSDEFVRKLADAMECTIDDLLDVNGDPWNFNKSPE